MNERLNNALAVLAEKLGTSVDHIWEILVRQARISATVDLIQYAAVVVCCMLWWKYRASATSEDWEYAGARSVGVVSSGTVLAILIVVCFICFGNTVSALLNPEYWALQKILGAIRG